MDKIIKPKGKLTLAVESMELDEIVNELVKRGCCRRKAQKKAKKLKLYIMRKNQEIDEPDQRNFDHAS